MTFKTYSKIIGFLAFILLIVTAAPLSAAPASMVEADNLLKSPTLDTAQAEKALKIYQELLNTTYDRSAVLAQLGRTCFILGGLFSKYGEGYYRKGKGYAETLIFEDPNRTEGHYWRALNLCGIAEIRGYMMARRLLPEIMQALERSLALDETYDQAGAHRTLGRIYCEAPTWPMSIGDLDKSLEHLRSAVRLAPENSTNRLYLAHTLGRLHYRSLARQELERVLTCTQYAHIPQDLEDDKREARSLLADYAGYFGGSEKP
jgi:tetratricopeptide (TPR) repeat protein